MEENHEEGNHIPAIWIGVAIGAAIGIGIALKRSRRESRWDSARHIGERLAEHSPDFKNAGRDILDRVKTIYDEGCKVVEEASGLWTHGRKLVQR